MEDLILLEDNSIEENILAIIEFIRQVEREHGLSEEEIVYKYTCGMCWQFASCITRTLKFLFGVKDVELSFRLGDMKFIDHHVYVEYRDRKLNRFFYFDILGKKTEREVVAFMQSDFWEKQSKPELLMLDGDKSFWDADYVDKACLEHIAVEGDERLIL